MLINPLFKIESIVYFITDPMQDEYMIIGYKVYKNTLKYIVGHAGENEIECFDYEITDTKIIK